MQETILSVRDLHVKFRLRGRTLHALRGITLDVYEGESLAIVGESGSGKSVLNKNFIGLLDGNGFVDVGEIRYYGAPAKFVGHPATADDEEGRTYVDLTRLSREADWLKIRGSEICMIPQDPMTSLNPLKSIGKQILEALELHQHLKGKAAKEAAAYEWKWSAEQDEIALKECLARGMVINDVSDEPAWTEAARSVWPQFYDKVGGKAVVDEALAIMQQ